MKINKILILSLCLVLNRIQAMEEPAAEEIEQEYEQDLFETFNRYRRIKENNEKKDAFYKQIDSLKEKIDELSNQNSKLKSSITESKPFVLWKSFEKAVLGKNPSLAKNIIEENMYFINFRDFLGNDSTPLSFASENGYFELVKFLVENGAVGISEALLAAISRENFFFGKFESPGSKSSQAMQIIKFLLEHGADVNFVDKEGNTPLKAAVVIAFKNEDNSLRIIKLLLDHGAKINQQSGKHNSTALGYAETEKRRLEKSRESNGIGSIIEYLKENGATE